MPLPPLTPAELYQQLVRGLRMRVLLQQATNDMAAHTPKPGLLLSGGVDSTSTLWTLLRAGARPHVLTFQVPGAKLSSDGRKAQQLAESARLPCTVVTLPSAADDVARRIEQLVIDHEALTTRADLEVLCILEVLFERAAQLGLDSLYTGIGDGGVHLVNRTFETRGRSGQLSPQETDALRLMQLSNTQFPPTVELARKHGLMLAAPLRCAVHQLPYQGVPWHVMNRPVAKSITLNAFQQENAAANVTVRAQPLQCGDTGSRAYFDGLLSQSAHARRVAGKQVTTAQVYYNALQKKHHQRSASQRRSWRWETWRRNVLGVQPPENWVPEWPLNAQGRASAPPSPTADTRVDCWGIPFWVTHRSSTNCLRAQLGHCGTHHPRQPWSLEACEDFEVFYRKAQDELRLVGKQHKGTPLSAVYDDWATRMDAVYTGLARRYGVQNGSLTVV